MRINGLCLRFVLLATALCTALPGYAQGAEPGDDPGYRSAVDLLRKAVQKQPENEHVIRVRGLRFLEDPALKPLFERLLGSEDKTMQIFGVLGLAQLNEGRLIDLTQLAEIEDPATVSIALASALDDDLIDTDRLKTIYQWKDLDMLTRMQVMIRLVLKDEPVDINPLKEVAAKDLAEPAPTRRDLYEYAYACILLMMKADPAGEAGLERLRAIAGNDSAMAISGMFRIALRDKTGAMGPFALRVAKDEKRGLPLRTQAITAALRLKAEGAEAYWRQWLEAESDAAQRARLAIAALDASVQLDPGSFDVLLKDESEFLKRIGTLGKAIGAGDVPGQREAVDKLLSVGVRQTTEWVVAYVRREEPENGAELLERVLNAFPVGMQRKNMAIVKSSADASYLMCTAYPDEALERIPAFLAKPIGNEKVNEARMSIVLDGISRSTGEKLKQTMQAIKLGGIRSTSIQAMYLLQCARNGVALEPDQWLKISGYVQGVGIVSKDHRTQLAWLYLKHKGWSGQAIAEAFE